MCAINSFTSRVKIMLFRVLMNQEIGFYETAKTGTIICPMFVFRIGVRKLVRSSLRFWWKVVGISALQSIKLQPSPHHPEATDD